MIGYVGAVATKSILLGLIILATAALFVPLHILHPWWMLTFLVLTAVTFSLFGFIIGIWADGFEKLQMIPMLVVTPLTFLGGSFYSVNMLPSGWRTITLLNPVVYLISGFRWSFYEIADVSVALSLGMTLGFLAICMALVWWIFGPVPAEELMGDIIAPDGAKRNPGHPIETLAALPGFAFCTHPRYFGPSGRTREKVSATAGLRRPAALFAPPRALTIASRGPLEPVPVSGHIGCLGTGGAGSFRSRPGGQR